MGRTRVWVLVGVIAVAGPVWGQRIVTLNAPRPAAAVPVVAGVFPPGATIGTTTVWTLTGRNLGRVERVRVSGPGVEAGAVKLQSNGSVVVTVRVAPDAEPGFRAVRAEAPDGLSNLVVVGLGPLPQTVEVEPNDDPAHATDLKMDAAAVGVLTPQDLDHYRVPGRAGQRVHVEVEARRLGSSVVPRITLLGPTGAALAQGRETRGGDREGRLTYLLPKDGLYVIRVHDATFGGGPSAGYRLRVEADPTFATGLYPLGGTRGRSITVVASGGSLKGPLSKTIGLPDQVGALVDPGPFDGSVVVPQRLVVGDGPEVFESSAADGTPTPLPLGATANGRIDAPGEVDRYVVTVRKGLRLHIHVEAAALGSWLDSVVTLRDADGRILAENDDSAGPSPDSLLDSEAKADGPLTIELTDRFGDGGPEYAYRLTVGPPRPDFTIALVLGNPNTARQLLVPATGRAREALAPGASGSLNLKPGTTLPINFLVTSRGRAVTVRVRADGLPAGVTAEPVTVAVPTAFRGTAGNAQPVQPVGGVLLLRVAPNAAPALGELRVVATASREDGPDLVRLATAMLSVESGPGNDSALPSPRLAATIVVKVVGTSPPDAPTLVAGAGAPPTLQGIEVPGVLLQGGRIDLALVVGPDGARADPFDLRAEAVGRGLSIAATAERVTVRVLAAVDAEPGVGRVKVRFQPTGGSALDREASVIVRPPLNVWARPDPIALRPGESAAFRVGIERESGYNGPVELRVSDLPVGVKMVGRVVVAPEEFGGMVRLTRAGGAGPMARPAALRIAGVARMPNGQVTVESPIRPMLRERSADE